jgi:hypothetical protein
MIEMLPRVPGSKRSCNSILPHALVHCNSMSEMFFLTHIAHGATPYPTVNTALFVTDESIFAGVICAV